MRIGKADTIAKLQITLKEATETGYWLELLHKTSYITERQIPQTSPTTNKTIRFPNDAAEEAEKTIQGKDFTFSAFVIAAVRAAHADLRQS